MGAKRGKKSRGGEKGGYLCIVGSTRGSSWVKWIDKIFNIIENNKVTNTPSEYFVSVLNKIFNLFLCSLFWNVACYNRIFIQESRFRGASRNSVKGGGGMILPSLPRIPVFGK